MIVCELNDSEYQKIIQPFCNRTEGPWAAGGSVRKVWQGKPWKEQDIDFFFRSYDQFETMRSLIANMSNASVYFSSDNAITYNLDLNNKPITDERIWNLQDLQAAADKQKNILRIQLIKKNFHNSLNDLLNSFDIGLSQFASDGQSIFATEQAVKDCTDGVIRPAGSSSRFPSPNRVLKYLAYGFEPENELFCSTLSTIYSQGLKDDSY